MTMTTPSVQPVRVRPLWERHELFRAPEYTGGSEWDADDGGEDNDGDLAAD